MGRVIAVIGSVFVITVGVLVGTKMSADAVAIIIGVIIGIVASVPTTLMFAYVVNRRSEQAQGRPGMMGGGQYPPVVVVTPGAGAPAWGAQMQATPALPPAPGGPRSYEVVGEFVEEERYAER